MTCTYHLLCTYLHCNVYTVQPTGIVGSNRIAIVNNNLKENYMHFAHVFSLPVKKID